MTGKYAAEGWKHRAFWRCTNEATWITGPSSSRRRYCDACREHMRSLYKAEISLGNNGLKALRESKRLRGAA